MTKWIIFCFWYSKLFLYNQKHETVTDNPPLEIYVNKIENRITFKIKTGYYHQFLTPESMKLLGNTKNKVSKDINGESVSHLEVTEVVLVHCNVVNNDYQHDSRVFDAFTPNKSFGQILDISPINLIILSTFNSEFPFLVKF